MSARDEAVQLLEGYADTLELMSSRNLPGLSREDSLREDSLRAARHVRRVAASLQVEREGWQPIETAPKDGGEIFLWYPEAGDFERVRWAKFLGNDPCWVDTAGEGLPIPEGNGQPSHWRPLLAPPATDQRKE